MTTAIVVLAAIAVILAGTVAFLATALVRSHRTAVYAIAAANNPTALAALERLPTRSRRKKPVPEDVPDPDEVP